MDKFLEKNLFDSAVLEEGFGEHFTTERDEKTNSFEILKGKKESKEDVVSDLTELPAKQARFEENEVSEYNLEVCPHNWRSILSENLNLQYTRIFTKRIADYVFKKLEEEVEYFSGDLLRVKVFGKWHNIPRKQVSFGDPGLSYTFSGTCVPAVPWSKCKIVMELKKIVESVSGHSFNFVLINRYKDGMDHMGEHRDDEKDLVATAPIASLSLGQPRDFIFKHTDARKSKTVHKIAPIKVELEHGSLLLMNWPTNRFWYHSLPVRKKAVNVRINLTFRQMLDKKINTSN